MLADAAQALDGKLYIHGGGWDTISAASFPTVHPSLALALLFRVEYSEAPGQLPLEVRLVDADEKEEKLNIKASVNVGHPPGSIKGEPSFVPFTVTIPGLQFDQPASYSFKITGGEEWLGVLPLHIRHAP